MSIDVIAKNDPRTANKRGQFTLCRMFVAMIAVAILFGVAAAGGWVKSDTVVYLTIAIIAGVFSRAARRALLGACTILAAFWLALFLGDMAFGLHGRSVDPRAAWIFAGLLVAAAVFLRLCTRASALSLVASLILVELFVIAVLIYLYGCPTLFSVLTVEDRTAFFVWLRMHFVEQRWYIAAPWLIGVVLGEIVASRQRRKFPAREASSEQP